MTARVEFISGGAVNDLIFAMNRCMMTGENMGMLGVLEKFATNYALRVVWSYGPANPIDAADSTKLRGVLKRSCAT